MASQSLGLTGQELPVYVNTKEKEGIVPPSGNLLFSREKTANQLGLKCR